MAEVLAVQDLRKRFGRVDVLKGVNFGVQKNQVVALMGPNGSGKTTLIRIVVTAEKPSAGEVKVMGYDTVKQPRQVRESINYLPQDSFLSYPLTGLENLMFYARLMGMDTQKASKRTMELLEIFGLADERKKKVGHYSGGMRKKLALASCLLLPKPLLLLDEPTTGLDPIARKELLGLLLENAQDSSIVLASHIGEDAEIASKVIFIHQGRVIDMGSPSELKKKYVTGKVFHVKLPVKSKRIEEVLRSHSIKGSLLVTDEGYRVYTENIEEIKKGLEALKVQALVEASAPSLEDAFTLAITGGNGHESN